MSKPEGKSHLSQKLTEEMFQQLKDKKTNLGYTWNQLCQPAFLLPDDECGVMCGDEDCYTGQDGGSPGFHDLLCEIILAKHGYDARENKHPTDLNPANVEFTEDQKTMLSKYVLSTHMQSVRNIRGQPLQPGATKETRKAVEELLAESFGEWDGEYKGTYHKFDGMDDEVRDELKAKGFLFDKPRELAEGQWKAVEEEGAPIDFHGAVGGACDWPNHRGVFVNESNQVSCWVNHVDHCTIFSQENSADVKSVFTRLCKVSDLVNATATAKGTTVMHNEGFGFITTCPSNIGTALRASVKMNLTQFDPELLQTVGDKFNLQATKADSESGNLWEISNTQRIGFSEVQLVQKLIDGVHFLCEWEEKLTQGSSKEDCVAAVGQC